MIIGFNRWRYSTIRCIIKKVPQNRYINLYTPDNIYKIEPKNELKNLKWDIALTIDDFMNNSLCHLYNAINGGNNRYITTFETIVPRIFSYNDKDLLNKMFEHLYADKCKAIIAISKDAYYRESKFINEYCPVEYRDNIFNKLFSLHPPQELFSKEIAKIEDKINFIFVGRDFFRKGGYEVLKAFEKISKQHNNFHLYIVSNFSQNWDVMAPTAEELAETKTLIQNSAYITHYEELPNEDVIKLIKKCHVGLLPTYDDSYGFSVLEMQACGVPVITSDIRVMPEINNDSCGWLIELPKDFQSPQSYEIYKKFSYRKNYISQLFMTIQSILLNPEIIYKKSARSVAKIIKMHDPVEYAKILKLFYI